MAGERLQVSAAATAVVGADAGAAATGEGQFRHRGGCV